MAVKFKTFMKGLCMHKKFQQGFTLIEIMVVLVIIGVMAALIVPRVMGRAADAKVIAAKSDINTIMNALKLYNLDNGRYPTNEQGLNALINKPNAAPIPLSYKDGGYLEKLPIDPWGNPYQYQNPGKHGEIDVYSFGVNASPSAGEDGKVIGSW
jgi:general secretion pathway protein G